jgi:CubicO group peptidase (beta-lactamase class C family)
MKYIILFLLIPFTFATYAQTGIPIPEMTHCDTQAQSFMNTFDIPGMTMALAKDGKLVYSRAFGNADLDGNQPTQPYNIFRVASVSKPITSIGIMKMMEDGLLNMNDKVFGSGGILENHWVFSNANITDNRVYDITVQMLLEHSGGWDSSVNCNPNPTTPYPWFFSGCHPIDIPLHVTEVFGQPNPVKEEHLIQYILEKPLNHTPGAVYAYSNMGFLLLSEIIEEISGMDYEAWMQQEIFNPLGIFDMHIGENLLEDKREREGEYVGNGYSNLDLYGSGNMVPWTYGGASVNAMDGHGGWIATARDLLRLLVAVDGFSTKPDILSPFSIATMSTPSSAFQYYAKGWQVNASNNWWHSGAISGTASYYVRTSNGYTWAIILNKRIIDGNSGAFWGALDALGWNCISGTSSWPTHDFFESPTVNASNIYRILR